MSPLRDQRASRSTPKLNRADTIQGQIIGLTANSALRTFTLRRDPLSSQWLLESITDGY